MRLRRALCAESAQKYANPELSEQTRCQPARHGRRMGKVITIQFRRSKLPRRLLNDAWWLETPRPRAAVVALPKRRSLKPKSKTGHLTLVTSGQ
jgi:hypothetical protein